MVYDQRNLVGAIEVPRIGRQFSYPISFLPLRTLEMSVRLSSLQDYSALLDKYDTWMFDCDGVLWHGDRIIDGVVEVLEMLRRYSKSPCPISKVSWDGLTFGYEIRKSSLSLITPQNQERLTKGNLTTLGYKHMWCVRSLVQNSIHLKPF